MYFKIYQFVFMTRQVQIDELPISYFVTDSDGWWITFYYVFVRTQKQL